MNVQRLKAFDLVEATKLWFPPFPSYPCFFDAELAPKKKAEAVEIYLKEIAKLTA